MTKNFFKTLPLRTRTAAMHTNEQKVDEALFWISQKGGRLKDFQAVLPLVTSENYRSKIAKSWLSKEGRSLEDLKEFLPLVNNGFSQSDIVNSWLSEERRSLEDLKAVFQLITEENYKFYIAKSYLNRTSNPQTKYENFTELAKAGIFPSSDKYDVAKISRTGSSLYLQINSLAWA